jgi:hypothetical protein
MPNPNNAKLVGWPIAAMLVPKAANSSIKAALLDAVDVPWDAKNLHAHPAFEFMGAVGFARLKDKAFRFTFVRNPYDRLVSCWAQKIDQPTHDNRGMRKMGFRPGMPWEEWLDAALSIPPEKMDIHFRPQSLLLCYRGWLPVDFVGKFEDLEHDWRVVQHYAQERAALKLPDLQKLTTSEHPPYREMFNQHQRLKVEAVYGRDFELFEYEF